MSGIQGKTGGSPYTPCLSVQPVMHREGRLSGAHGGAGDGGGSSSPPLLVQTIAYRVFDDIIKSLSALSPWKFPKEASVGVSSAAFFYQFCSLFWSSLCFILLLHTFLQERPNFPNHLGTSAIPAEKADHSQ